MNCSNIRNIIRESDLDRLDTDIREHLDRCPACKKDYESILALRNLIGLKKYEQPPDGFEQRNIDRVLRRIRDMEQDGLRDNPGDAVTSPRQTGIMDFLFHPPPAIQLAWAAGLLLLIGLGAALFLREPNKEQIAQPTPTPSEADLATSSTNMEPAHIQYGPQPSKAADFKY